MLVKTKGYSVLELIIVVAIMALLATLVIVYSSRGFTTDLNVATSGVTQALRDAREKTLASVDDTTWKVVFGEQTYSVECNKEGGCADERDYRLPDNVEFTAPITIEFARLTGATSQNQITIAQTGNASTSTTIYVSNSGVVSTTPPGLDPAAPTGLGARHIYIADGPLLNEGDDIELTFSGAGSGSVELSVDDVVDGYFIYSGPVQTGNGSAQFDMVAEVGVSSAEYHIYIDETEFAGVGLDLVVDGWPFIAVNSTGQVSSTYDEIAY